MLRVEYRASSPKERSLSYGAAEGNDLEPSIDFANNDSIQQHLVIEFAKGVSWTPQRIAVNGQGSNRTAYIMAKDNFKYRIYDLPALSAADKPMA